MVFSFPSLQAAVAKIPASTQLSEVQESFALYLIIQLYPLLGEASMCSSWLDRCPTLTSSGALGIEPGWDSPLPEIKLPFQI